MNQTAEQPPNGTSASRRARVVTDTEPPAVTINLSEEDRDTIENGIGDTMTLIHDAGAVFDFLALGLADGYMTGDTIGLASILRLSARAMAAAETNEIKALDLVDFHLRRVRVFETGGNTA